VTKEELQSIAEAVIVNWGLDLGGEPRKAFLRTWWRYLGDLNADAVQRAVDAAIIADKPFPPRAGGIRRTVLANLLTDVLTLEQAWGQVVDRVRAVEQGLWTEVSPLVAKALGEGHISGTSRDDREAFTRAWRRVVDELELDRLGLPAEES
jgi:hypothetical protein